MDLLSEAERAEFLYLVSAPYIEADLGREIAVLVHSITNSCFAQSPLADLPD